MSLRSTLLSICFFLISTFLVAQRWIQEASPTYAARENSVGFVIGNKAYLGTGYNGSFLRDFQSYDAISGTWGAVASMPGSSRSNSIAFEVGGFGFVTAGWSSFGASNNSSMYKYDPTTNGWTSVASYPGLGGRGCFATVYNGEAYVGAGGIGNTGIVNNDFWKYNPTTDTWTSLGNFPFSIRTGGEAFTIGNYMYFGFGHNHSSDFKDVWRFDPSNNSWTQISIFPGNPRLQQISFVLNGKAYVGGGHRLSGTILNDYYEYDPSSNTWSIACNFPGVGRSNAAGFVIGNLGYVFAGRAGGTNYIKDLWSYNPVTSTYMDTVLCESEILFLNKGIPGGSYLWNFNSTIAAQTFPQQGLFWVDVTVNGCTIRDSINLTYLPNPIVDLGNDTSLCSGEMLQLIATAVGGTYLWKNNSTLATQTITQAGIYWVDVTVNGCTTRDSIEVAFSPGPIVNLGNDTSFCDNSALNLNAITAGGTYLWQDNSTLGTFTVTQTGIYWVDVTVNGCTTRDSIEVTYFTPPVVNLGNDTSLCGSATLFLDVTRTGGSYLWKNNSSIGSQTITQAGIYWVDVTVNGCTTRDSIEVVFTPGPIVNLGNDTSFCDNSTLALDVTTAGGTYLWQDNSTLGAFAVSQTGIYWVDVTVNGCTTRDSITVTYFTPPVVNLGNDTSLCGSETLFLDVTNASASYLWKNNSTLGTQTINQAGIYWVDVTVNGCTTRDSIEVTYFPNPIVDLGNDTSFCDNSTLLLDVTITRGTYLWKNNSTLATQTISQTGIYWVDVTVSGCTTRDSIEVTYFTPPLVNLGNDTSLCGSETLFLDVTRTGGSYLWKNNSTLGTQTITQAGTYWVDVTVSGCVTRDSIGVTYIPNPIVDLGADSMLCKDDTLILDGTSSGGTYKWQDNSTLQTFEVTKTGNYWVDVTVNGCTSRDSIFVEFLETPVVNLMDDTTMCYPQQLELNVFNEGANYLWQDGNTNPVYLVTGIGKYYVEVENVCGFTSDTIQVNFMDCDCFSVVSNVFTPNGDGINDVFKVLINCPITTFEMNVFNRWGENVFTSKNENINWDGRTQGYKSPSGTYYYIISYANPYTSEAILYKGSLMLLR